MELRQFGPYRIEELIGRGGMGEVHRAFDTEHQRTVALKVLAEDLAADRGYRERFRREAHAAARLSDPHVVPIHRYGEIDGRLFLDMRLVSGRDLATVLTEEGPLSPARAVSVVGQVARALDAAHAEGLVHRDVKPSNVLVCSTAGDPVDDDEFVYLVDFGIARSVMDDGGTTALTQAGSAVGSFDYMAPERFLEQPADARTDVYSLACVLFECLTGRRPFGARDLAPLMWAHVNDTPPAVSSLRTGVPSALDEVVARGLAKDPADRFASAGALAAAARRALSSSGTPPRPVPAAPSSDPRPLPGPAGATRLPLAPPPPPPPAGTGPGAVAPPAGSRRSRLPAVLLTTAALLAAALVAVVLLAGGGGEAAADPPARPTETARHDDLLALVPADFDAAGCRPAPTAGDGDVAAADCGRSATEDGPRTARFFLYPDGRTAEAAFTADVERLALPQLANGARCPASQGYQDWTLENEVKGQIACYVDEENTAVLVWTETEDAVEAVVTIRNGGTAGLAALREWWDDPALSTFGEA
ncbi:serine/threonine protein kinase [Geodermatophilus aquaeductus]|uniref:non-specific serine/threonine protein kinase n=1 Tax=Geodermatophilus aquaeductus TaxID=1564161 RepID=A0A521F695_9ACTN|nr:serine/threonine-protein kinase [Geodermatophilus aquaeductus]SMO91663.1 serine/threonine protein kinase [Geodermatophilus aquaeductus]